MYEFIETNEDPAMARLTSAYKRLTLREQTAREARTRVRKTANALAGILQAKRPDAKVARERLISFHEALIAEQATKQPLIEALVEMREIISSIHNVMLIGWMDQARRMNVIASEELLGKAIKTCNNLGSYESMEKWLAETNKKYQQIFPQPGQHSYIYLSQEYNSALGRIDTIPRELPSTEMKDRAKWDLLLYCLLIENRNHISCVTVDHLDSEVVFSVIDILRKAGWHAQMQRQTNADVPPALELMRPSQSSSKPPICKNPILRGLGIQPTGWASPEERL